MSGISMRVVRFFSSGFWLDGFWFTAHHYLLDSLCCFPWLVDGMPWTHCHLDCWEILVPLTFDPMYHQPSIHLRKRIACDDTCSFLHTHDGSKVGTIEDSRLLSRLTWMFPQSSYDAKKCHKEIDCNISIFDRVDNLTILYGFGLRDH